MTFLLDAAKEYLKLGYSVLPVMITWDGQKFQKKPTVDWKKYQAEYATEEDLNKWFGNRSTNNGIGIVTGKISRLFVIDVDSKEDADQDIEELKLKSIKVVKTISGGKHFYYQINEKDRIEIKNAVKIGERKVDIRGEGGFVVAPPSKAIKDNQEFTYSWEKGESLETVFLPKLTDEILKEIKVKKNLTTSSKWWTENGPANSLNLIEKLNQDQGSRNDSLYRVACSLLNKHTPEEAWQLIIAFNNTYHPPIDKIELRTLFRSAHEFIEKSGKEENKDGPESLLIGQPILWSAIKEEENRKQWIWENFIARGNVTLLSALWKAGKTTFLRCLFVAMKNEEEFAGQPTKNTKVLIVSEEAKGEWVEGREGLSKEEVENILVWSRPIRVKPNLRQWVNIVQEITNVCLEQEVGMVVIDTLTTFWPIDNENDSAQVIKALVPLYSFTESNIAVLLVHHFRKGGGTEAQASRGSGALPGFVDNIIEFTRSDEGYLNRRTLKTYGRFDTVIEPIVIEFQTDGKYKTLGEPWVVSKVARVERVVKYFNETNKPLSIPEIVFLWNADGGNISSRTIRRYVYELVEKGILKMDHEEVVTNKITSFYVQKAVRCSF